MPKVLPFNHQPVAPHWLARPLPDHRGHVRGALSVQVAGNPLQCNVRLRDVDGRETWLVALIEADSGIDVGRFHVAIDPLGGVALVDDVPHDYLAAPIDRLTIGNALAVALDEAHAEMWLHRPHDAA